MITLLSIVADQTVQAGLCLCCSHAKRSGFHFSLRFSCDMVHFFTAANCFIADIVDNAIYYEKAPADVTLNPMEIRTFQVNLVKGKSYKHLDKFSVFS